jgi:hypothetical protein
MTEATSAALVEEWLKEAGYRAEISSVSQSIHSATAGLQFVVAYLGTDSVQFYLSIVLDESDLTIEDCNRFNRQFRFAKIYIDDDGDLMMETDAILAGSEEDRKQTFRSMLEVWDGLVGALQTFMREVYETKQPSPVESREVVAKSTPVSPQSPPIKDSA